MLNDVIKQSVPIIFNNECIHSRIVCFEVRCFDAITCSTLFAHVVGRFAHELWDFYDTESATIYSCLDTNIFQ